MKDPSPLNLFYEEPDPDRWLPLDRYPRRVVRRIVRGKRRPGGQERVFLNLCAGLDRIGVAYRVNDYRHIRSHPDELACIIGKPHLLEKIHWENPILFGAATFSHPIEQPDFFQRFPNVKKILVPGEWMRRMWIEHYPPELIEVWPVGIDTDLWSPSAKEAASRPVDFLIYDKVRWEHERYEEELLQPIRTKLSDAGLTASELRYGYYEENQFREMLRSARAMLFLCEHETQGIAYQQALSQDVPILAWDRGGFWQDPVFYPDKVQYRPVSSVPYWDSRCGVRFTGRADFEAALEEFMTRLRSGDFAPRDFILENLTLENCARDYVSAAHDVIGAG